MIPVLSSQPLSGGWAEPVNSRVDPLKDFENGGPVLNEGSSDSSYTWRVYTSGATVLVDRDGVPPEEILTGTDITEVALAFDQTMHPHVAYVDSDSAYWYYWNTLANGYSVMDLPGARSPRCCTDEKNPQFSGDRDIILTYMRGSTVYVRLQRDRFGVEYAMVPDPESAAFITDTTRIVSIGMNTGRRLQWRLE